MKRDITARLREHDATQSDLASSQRHWAEVIEKETNRDDFTKQDEHDEAYVAALEKARGRNIDVDEYARISAGMERGAADAALSAAGLPRQALFPVERVWMRRVMLDSTLEADVRRALARARGSKP
jgi:hypothetical protein